MDRARVFFEAGEYEKAKIAYISILQKSGWKGEIASQLGTIWSLQGATMQALPYLKKAREMGNLPDSSRAQYIKALLATGQESMAQAEAESAMQDNPGNGEVLVLLVSMSRQPEELIEAQHLIDRFPDKDSAYFHLAVSMVETRAGSIINAEQAVAKALAADPKLPMAHLAAASVRRANGDLRGAEESIKTGSELAPVRSPERLRYIEFKVQQGQTKEAQVLVAEVVKLASDFLPALIVSAQLAHGAKAYDEALAILEKVFSIDSFNISGRLLQADALVAKGEPKQAIQVLQRLDQVYEGARPVRMKLAQSMMSGGDLSGAAELLNKMLVRAPDRGASLLLAEINLRLGNPAAVVPAMEALLEQTPGDEATSIMLARALETQRRFEEALRVIQKLTELKPENALYHAMIGNVHLQLKQVPEARTAYETSLSLAPADEAVWVRLVELDLAEGKTEEALARCAVRLKSEPKSASVTFMQARVHLTRKEWEPAEADLLKTLELDANHPTVQETLSRLYSTTGRVPEAIEKVEQRLVANAKDLRALRLLALLRTQGKEFEKAAEVYERLTAALPAPEPFVLNNLANLYADHLNKPEQAYELARQARALRPSVEEGLTVAAKLEAAAIADTLGWLLYRRGEVNEAYTLLQEAVTALSEQPEVQAHLGLTAAAMGQTEVAKDALAKAIASAIDFPVKAEAQQQLALLNGDSSTTLTSVELAAMAEKNADDPLLQLRLGEALEKEKKLPEAVAAYDAALTLNPELQSAALQLATLHAGPLQDPTKALQYAKKARELAPNDAKTAALLGDLAYRTGDHSWAYDLLSEATRGGAKGAEPLLNYARAAYSVGRVEDSRLAMQQCLAASPDAAMAAEAASFLELTAVAAPAATFAEAVLKNDADNVPALLIRADAQLKAGESAAAGDTYKTILALYPNFAPARKELAAVLARDPSTRDQAYALALKARETLPDDAELTETVALLTYHRKDYKYAVELFSDAARVRPPQAEALFYLGLTHLALKETEAGRDSLTKAVAAGLSEPEATEAARLLEPEKK